MIALVGATALDVISTEVGIARCAHCAETNPNPMARTAAGRVGLMALQVGAVALVSHQVPVAGKVFGWTLAVGHLGAAGWNVALTW